MKFIYKKNKDNTFDCIMKSHIPSKLSPDNFPLMMGLGFRLTRHFELSTNTFQEIKIKNKALHKKIDKRGYFTFEEMFEIWDIERPIIKGT